MSCGHGLGSPNGRRRPKGKRAPVVAQRGETGCIASQGQKLCGHLTPPTREGSLTTDISRGDLMWVQVPLDASWAQVLLGGALDLPLGCYMGSNPTWELMGVPVTLCHSVSIMPSVSLSCPVRTWAKKILELIPPPWYWWNLV